MNGFFAPNVSLKEHTTYRIGGYAKHLCFVYDLDGLYRALELSANRIILGRGSKVLVSDSGFDGAVIVMRLSRICFGSKLIKNISLAPTSSLSSSRYKEGEGIPYLEEDEVYAEAGVSLSVLSKVYETRSLQGLEWAALIPGNVGGALKLNAGCYGGDIAGILRYCFVLRSGKVVRLTKDECGFSYRTSSFYPSDIILGAVFKAERGESEKIESERLEYNEKRRAAQPSGFSCGSVFKADKMPAYTYIEKCGLKGLTVGDAFISEKHANFIINKGAAKAKDVLTLIRTIKSEVFSCFNVQLKEEVIYIGDF